MGSKLSVCGLPGDGVLKLTWTLVNCAEAFEVPMYSPLKPKPAAEKVGVWPLGEDCEPLRTPLLFGVSSE